MEEYRVYLKGNWTTSGKGEPIALYDGTWWYSEWWVQFSSKDKARTCYKYYVGKVDGKEIKSTNYLKYDFEGRNCTISIVDEMVDSRSRSVDDIYDTYEVVDVGFPIRIE